MSEAIGQTLIFAVGIAIFPIPMITAVLILLTSDGKKNGLAFLVGWMTGILLLGAILLSLASPYEATSSGHSAAWINWLRLIIGMLLLYASIRKLRAKLHKDSTPVPRWMETISSLTFGKSLGIGLLLSALNPKNILLAIGAVSAIAQADISTTQRAGTWVTFTLIASLGVLIPVVITLLLGQRALTFLNAIKEWLQRNNTTILVILMLIIGTKLIGDAITGFSLR